MTRPVGNSREEAMRRKLSDACDLLHEARDAIWHQSDFEGYFRHDPKTCPGCKLESEIDQFLPHPATATDEDYDVLMGMSRP